MNSHDSTTERFASVTKMPTLYSALGWEIGTYRWLIFNRDSNGFNACLLKIGSRWVINLEKFEAWLQANPATAQAAAVEKREWKQV